MPHGNYTIEKLKQKKTFNYCSQKLKICIPILRAGKEVANFSRTIFLWSSLKTLKQGKNKYKYLDNNERSRTQSTSYVHSPRNNFHTYSHYNSISQKNLSCDVWVCILCVLSLLHCFEFDFNLNWYHLCNVHFFKILMSSPF